VVEDWAAVARAISQRMTELGINQRELIERSQVSKATVGELYHNSVQRRRAPARQKHYPRRWSGTRGT
jgi:predicted transcriptional regulator